MRRVFSSAIGVVVLLLLGGVTPAAGSLTVSIQPWVTCAELGDTIEIAVNASGPDSVGWYYVRVYTDEAVLTYLDCSTQILNGCPTGSQCMECGLTGEPGIFSACCACLGTHTCVAAGDLVIIRYVVTGEGMSPVQFDGAYVDDCDRIRISLDAVDDGVVYLGQASTDPDNEGLDLHMALTTCYPNPFRDQVTLAVRIPDGKLPTAPAFTRVSIKIFDCRGSKVRDFPVMLSPGEHTFTWDGRDRSGVVVPPGVYFSRLVVGGEVITHKITKIH